MTPLVGENEGRLLGNADAAVAIRDFSDFRCPHCRDAALDLTPKIIENYIKEGSQVSFEFVPVAALGDESMLAAQASLCAEDQSQFWPYHDKLFEQQSSRRWGTFLLVPCPKAGSSLPSHDHCWRAIHFGRILSILWACFCRLVTGHIVLPQFVVDDLPHAQLARVARDHPGVRAIR